MKIIHANQYSVYVGSIKEDSFADFLKTNYSGYSIFIIVDENSLKYCYPSIAEIINNCTPAEIIEIESGEQNKNIDVCKGIWEALTDLNADRNSLIINLGGGVICDMGAFVASTFKRGIDFIHIPTTLLSQADASVGGKTGVDLNGIKNQVGLFSFPKAVFVDTSFLHTLERNQLLSGFAEIIKHSLIADSAKWEKIKKQKPEKLFFSEDIIYDAIRIKNDIVNNDPYEKGKRKILNFGHTIGHALEAFGLENPEKFLLHGEAVAIGMIAESYISYKKNMITKSILKDINEYIKQHYKIISYDNTDYLRILELMKNDKKNHLQKINFTLLQGVGQASYDNFVEISLIKESIDYCQNY